MALAMSTRSVIIRLRGRQDGDLIVDLVHATNVGHALPELVLLVTGVVTLPSSVTESPLSCRLHGVEDRVVRVPQYLLRWMLLSRAVSGRRAVHPPCSGRTSGAAKASTTVTVPCHESGEHGLLSPRVNLCCRVPDPRQGWCQRTSTRGLEFQPGSCRFLGRPLQKTPGGPRGRSGSLSGRRRRWRRRRR